MTVSITFFSKTVDGGDIKQDNVKVIILIQHTPD